MTTLGIQIASKVEEHSDYDGIWEAYAHVTTEKSRKGKGIPAEDERIMEAVAHALAALVLADEAKKAAAAIELGKKPHPFPAPSVGLSAYATFAYVKLETMDGTKAEANAALAKLDKAIKAFNLSSIGL
jgi:hypothetical protein